MPHKMIELVKIVWYLLKENEIKVEKHQKEKKQKKSCDQQKNHD